MAGRGPGLRKNDAVATKAVRHRDPVVEGSFVGIAFRSFGLGAFVDPSTDDAKQIEVGETFVIELDGRAPVRAAAFDGGALPANGAKLWIRTADNKLVTAGGAGTVPFGVVDRVDTAMGLALVNQNMRDIV